MEMVTVLTTSGGLIDFVSGKIGSLQNVVEVAAWLVAASFVVVTFAKTKSFVALLVTLITAGFFGWGVSNLDWFNTKIEAETASTTEAMAPATPPGPWGES